MVVPLLAVLAYGAQMYGADRAAAAQEVADYRGNIKSRIIGAGMEADQRLTNQILGNLGEQHFQSGEQAVSDLSAANQRGAFAGAANQLGSDIQGVQAAPGAIDPMVQAGAENIAFQRHLASTQAGNRIRTDSLNEVLKNNAGISAKNELVRVGMADKGDRDGQIRQRINDVLRLQNYATGVRQAALQRTGAQHSLDTASAASTGSGAMYLGALLQAGAVLANRPQTPGQPGAGLPPGQGPNPVPVGQDPYAPWINPNDPNGMNPYSGF